VLAHRAVEGEEVLDGGRRVVGEEPDLGRVPLDDPRTELLVNDGRNVLAATDRRFDVIVSEPSNPWLTGVANLFTREYFAAGAAHLNPGGLFCQWLQIYEMRPEEVATLVATFSTAFPEVYVFRSSTGDLVLLGGLEPFNLDATRLDAGIRAPGPVADQAGNAPAAASTAAAASAGVAAAARVTTSSDIGLRR